MSKGIVIGAIVSLAGLASCQNQSAGSGENTVADTTVTVATAPNESGENAAIHGDTNSVPASIVSEAPLSNFAGKYSGTLPCADCEGIETELTLNNDNTYSISRKYIGKDDERPFVSNGRWDWLSNNAMKLNDPSGPPTLIYVMEGKILMLDRSGNRVSGDLAEKYYLYKAK